MPKSAPIQLAKKSSISADRVLVMLYCKNSITNP